MINTAPNSPFKGYLPNVNPFGISPRYNPTGLVAYLARAKESEITDAAKPVDKSVANIEAERGEVLTTFNKFGLALHDIKGKPHSKGGTPLNVPEGSFIFSKDKSMALTKDELDTFKLGGYIKGNKENNTPAKVLQRNIDVKHNNKMLGYLGDSKDYAEKNTARLMLEKYKTTAGTIAALQEIRKQDGQVPSFGGLTPVDITSEKIAKQYSKGGWVLPKAKEGIPNQAAFKTMWDANYPQAENGSLDLKQDPHKFDWIKPYDWTPKLMSVAGNLMQMPKKYYPALDQQTGFRMRAQSIDAQPGINATLSQSYASRKANDQYTGTQQVNQLGDTQIAGQAMEYGSQIAKANQANDTDVYNKNAQIANQVLNANNSHRADYQDKINEMYQNVDDSRRQIGATNMNIMGEGYGEKNTYDMMVKGMKDKYAWDVENKMNQPNISNILDKYQNLSNNNALLQTNPTISYLIMKQMLTQGMNNKQKPDPSDSYRNILGAMSNMYGQF